MPPPFVYWKSRAVKRGAALTDLKGVDKVYELNDGESYEHRFPTSAAFRFNPEFKRDTELVDSFLNVNGMLVCSQRLKDFIASHQPSKVEYLPVAIHDLKGKVVCAPYFIVHPIDPVDCIDLATSDVVWSELDSTTFLFVRHLEIDAAKVPADRILFRAKAHNEETILRREFALAIAQAGFTGTGWIEIE